MEQAGCPDCGPAAVNHFVERWATIIDILLRPFYLIPELVWRLAGPLVLRLPFAPLALPLFRLLQTAHLGVLKSRCDARDSLRTLALWQAAETRGIELFEFRLFNLAHVNFFVARCGPHLRVFDTLPRPNRMPSKSLYWMDDKGSLKRHLTRAHLPSPQGKACFSYPEARKVFQEIGKPAIVKPALGSRSRHTTVHIENEAQLELAFGKAKQLSPWVMVEKELSGMVYRATVVGGKVVGVIRREPAHVTGNGVATVRQLVVYENANPLRRGPIFHDIPWDKDTDLELQKQKLTRDSVPAAGQMVILNEKVSRSFGATTTDVTGTANLINIKLFEKVAEILDDPLVGIDFMIEDITKPWTAQPACGVIECNSMPFLDLHHFPYRGPARDAAGALWDLVFPDAFQIKAAAEERALIKAPARPAKVKIEVKAPGENLPERKELPIRRTTSQNPAADLPSPIP